LGISWSPALFFVSLGMEEKYYKWCVGADVYYAYVIGEVANYYKNGEVYALYQKWVLRPSDIEITKEEFLAA